MTSAPAVPVLFITTYSFPYFKNTPWDFPGGPVVKNPPANAGDMGSISGLGRFHLLWVN